MLCFTYFHAVPEFVDFLFSFGYQSHAQDPYFSLFRQRTWLTGPNLSFEISELGWSGSEIQMCYSMKSVERSGSDWSIRQCAVHHTFDTKNVRANWIIIKGNDIMEDRIKHALSGHRSGYVPSFETCDMALAASLATHLAFCDWAAEQWRWYINNLQDQFENMSRKTLTAPVALPQGQIRTKDSSPKRPRTNIPKTDGSIISKISLIPTKIKEKLSIAESKPEPLDRCMYTDPDSGLTQPLPPQIKVTYECTPESASQPLQPTLEDTEERDFSFAKLQKIQHIEEKAHEALLTLKLNRNIMLQLKQYYHNTVRSKYFPQDISTKCQDDLEQFELRVDGVISDLDMHVLRLDTLLRLLGDRKALVSQTIPLPKNIRLKGNQLRSILEYHNTEINKLSTKNMMSMTEDMNDIARKTKIETVSVKVITVVTLFFLPGTFISVRQNFSFCKVPTFFKPIPFSHNKTSLPVKICQPYFTFICSSEVMQED